MNAVDSSSKVERRSTRLTARPLNLAEEAEDDDDMMIMRIDPDYEQALAESESSMRGKKRKSREDKVSPQAKKSRGKRGLLRLLVEMPLDVLFEVSIRFRHLVVD